MKQVYLVGNCTYDSSKIKNILEKLFSVKVMVIDTISNAKKELENQKPDLLMVNRIIDTTGNEGMDLVKEVHRMVPSVLITNYQDVQKSAREQGAVASFGKQELYSSDVSGIKASLQEFLE